VYLCLSGRGGDKTYQTECEITTADNRFGGLSRCALAVSQKTVTDECYVPGVAPTHANATSTATGTAAPAPANSAPGVAGTGTRTAESAGSTSTGTASTLNSASGRYLNYFS
jgi:hypothetical protein